MSTKWRTVDVVDNFHGTPVADPFRWLENPDDQNTKAFIQEQNQSTFAYLHALPVRDNLRNRLETLWNFPRRQSPGRAGAAYYWSKSDGLQNQPVLYLQPTLDADGDEEARVLIDPNTMNAAGTAELANFSFTKDGRYVAYAISENGSDWQVVRVRDTQTGEDLEDELQFCKFTSLAWTSDGRGFYYTRFPEPGSVPPEDGSNYCQVYWHVRGTDQAEDELVYERPDAKELGFHPIVTDDGKTLMLVVTNGTATETSVYYRPLDGRPVCNADAQGFIRLFDAFDASYSPLGNRDDTFYFLTNKDAPRGRVISVNLGQPEAGAWRTVVPEQDVVLADACFAGGHILLLTMRDAHHELVVYDLVGTHSHDIPLPTLGALLDWYARDDESQVYITFTSFLYPPTVLRHSIADKTTETIFQPKLPTDLSQYETTQVFYTSKDGTKVPMFLTHKKGLRRDGTNPVLLTGYGGFNVSRTPAFSVPPLLLLEQGGVYALANLRGGGEYGDAWHRAGMLQNKQNVFDDFIAAAEYLCDRGYTNPGKLATSGGSNGGLLVSACMLQRPDLYGAVVCGVPVADMLRYHLFTVGRYWVPEYGNAVENPEHFRNMYAYSPLHNVQEGAVYPPILIHTGDTDDRVVPAHPFKLAAALQEKTASADRVWLRIDTAAGHGHGKPVSKQLDEQADIYAFLFDQLQIG